MILLKFKFNFLITFLPFHLKDKMVLQFFTIELVGGKWKLVILKTEATLSYLITSSLQKDYVVVILCPEPMEIPGGDWHKRPFRCQIVVKNCPRNEVQFQRPLQQVS